MTRILGIDPGSRITGFGIIVCEGQQQRYISSGCIRLNPKESFHLRLKDLHESFNVIVEKYQPQVMSIEQAFVHKNALSALKLGQARGALLAAAALAGLAVAEYAPADVKRTVAGNGRADKLAVQHMVKRLLDIHADIAADAADALALALCHSRYASGPLLAAKRRRR